MLYNLTTKMNIMKTPKSIPLILVLAIASAMAISCNQQQKKHSHGDSDGHNHDAMHTDHNGQDGLAFKNGELKSSFDQYILVQQALTATDFDKAKSNALILLSLIKKIDGADKASGAVQKLTEAGNIDEQRAAFSDLSNELLALVKGNLSSGELFVAHCPMALNNSGAYWITQVNEIKNPYFGDKMLKCGAVKETLN